LNADDFVLTPNIAHGWCNVRWFSVAFGNMGENIMQFGSFGSLKSRRWLNTMDCMVSRDEMDGAEKISAACIGVFERASQHGD